MYLQADGGLQMSTRCTVWAMLGLSGVCPAIAADTIVFNPECATQQLVVVPGRDVPSLLGHPIEAIRLYASSGAGLAPVVFQVDAKDADGRYATGAVPGDAQEGEPLLDENDELVFMAADAGARSGAGESAARGDLIELRIDNRVAGKSGWLYASVSARDDRVAENTRVRYDSDADSVQTPVYSVGFSSHKPFLIDTLKWKLGREQQWSPDVLDTMKIRHRGRLFGFIDFRRTGNDYKSRLTAVRAGPLRIIRRTENAVRILWKLKTPRVFVDYIMSPDGFVMDTIIDLPFRIGLFFSDIDTLTTVDWDSAPGLPRLTVASPDAGAAVTVSGEMDPEKQALNALRGTRFTASSAFGSAQVQLEIPADFAITPWLYFNDAITTPDAPEQVPGQFGHVGFRTTGWESIDTGVHHLQFKVCLQAGGAAQ